MKQKTISFVNFRPIAIQKIAVLLIASSVFVLSLSSQARALDGSGIAVVSPNSAQAGSLNASFQFSYTADELMTDASIRLTVPAPWPTPTGANVAVSLDVQEGLLADIFDTLDTPTIGDPGWIATDGLGGLLTNLVVNNTDPYQGSGNLQLNILVGVGLGQPQVYLNNNGALDWSGYTDMGFWIRQSAALGIAIGDISIGISESLDLAAPSLYVLDNTNVNVTLFDNSDWAFVSVDLTTQPASTRDAVLSFGLVLNNINIAALASLDIDHIVLGPGSPIFDGTSVTLNLFDLQLDGSVLLDYGPVTVPDVTGSYTFDIEQTVDAGGILTNLLGGSPILEIIDVENGGQDFRSRDTDSDGNDEFAIDTNEDGCFNFYSDLDQSSFACFSINGTTDNCVDHFIDVDSSGCTPCPDFFWDATNDVFSPLVLRDLDIDGDGTNEQVCAYDSNGDGNVDSYLYVDPSSPDGPTIGGEGGGQDNPFEIGGSGCGLSPTTNNLPFALSWIAFGLFCAALISFRARLHK